MDYSDYLREQAAECRRLAEAASDPATQEDLFESAAIYEEVANDLDDRRCSGWFREPSSRGSPALHSEQRGLTFRVGAARRTRRDGHLDKRSPDQ
jgi:hypothetical protein